MSPRKSSTSSGSRHPRPRYLGIEVAGEPFLPRPWLESTLAKSLATGLESPPGPKVRVIRSERSRAIVEIEHVWLARARRAWNGPVDGPSHRPVTIATVRTWGTLKDGKSWLRGRFPVNRSERGPDPR